MTFGMLIGVPTINGYSGAFPKNYPTEPFLSQKMPNQILDWLKNIDESQNGCWVTGRTPVRKISNNLNTVDLVGFTNTESDKDNSWNWATSPHPYFYVINFNKTSQKLNFEIKSSKCNSDQIINFEDSDGKILKSVNIYSKSKLVDLDLDFSDSIVKKIDIINKLKPCKIGEDPRNLYFEVKNLNIE
jgi:hypothetical protein